MAQKLQVLDFRLALLDECDWTLYGRAIFPLAECDGADLTLLLLDTRWVEPECERPAAKSGPARRTTESVAIANRMNGYLPEEKSSRD